MLSEPKFLEIYRRQQESGLSVKDFCSNEGLAESTYYYWQKKTRYKRANQDFIPLVVKPTQSFPSPDLAKSQTRHQGSGNADDAVLLELEYPNGTKLRIKQDLDLDHLRALVSLYD
jgi:hypothetical protein